MKILIIKTSALGDIVQAFSVITYLKEKFPESTIDWVVEQPFAPLVSAHPLINNTLTINTKIWRKSFFSAEIRSKVLQSIRRLRQDDYDVIFDLQGNVKSGIVTAFARGKSKVGFTYDSVAEWPNVLCTNKRFSSPKAADIRSTYLNLVQSYFNDLAPSVDVAYASVALKLTAEEECQLSALQDSLKKNSNPIIMVCHGSNWKNKQLTLDSLSEFLKLLKGHLNCNYVFVWGTEKEKAEASALHSQFERSVLLPKITLPVLQHLMASVKLIVAMDSLPLHLAATTSTPTFSVFGASLGERYAPGGDQHHYFQGDCPYGRSFSKRCPVLRSCQTGACIREISGKQLFDEYVKLIN